MRRKLLLLSLLLTTQAIPQTPNAYWRFRGFGMVLVQCRIVGNHVQNCVTMNGASWDGPMNAIYRATRNQEIAAE